MPRSSRGDHSDRAAGAVSPNGRPVLAARFAVPAVPKTYVGRARLTDRLTAALNTPLTLVNGPAGAGKTLLVADWITPHRTPWPVVWLTVETDDNAPGVFWAYVIDAFAHHGLPLPADIGRPARPGEVDRMLLVRLAAHLNGLAEPVVLVLDEFDRVRAPRISDEIEFVLRHAGAGLRLILVGRTEPLLPLHRYRAAGEVTEIRAADLAFQPGETAVLAERHGLSLTADGVRALTERTEGWAAGLRLCVLTALHADDPEDFLGEFEAGHSTIADFLLAEVLASRSDEVQDLLLRTSVLDRIHPDLANALTGRDDAAQVLAELARDNAFVQPIGHSWYRLHPLFAEILQAHLRVRHPGLEPGLHLAAAHWLSDAGLLAEALSHAARAGDWELAAAQFVDKLAIGRLFTGLDSDRLAELFAHMDATAAGPAVDLVRAARALARNDADRGLDCLRRAERELPADCPPTTRFTWAFLRVLAGRVTGSAELAEAAARDARALEGRIPTEGREDHPELSALLLTGLGTAQLAAGRFEAARVNLSAAARTGDGSLTAFPRHESLGRLALIDFLEGWPSRAEAHGCEALAEAERAGLPPAARSGVGQLVLAGVAVERDDLASARTRLEQVADSPALAQDPVATAELGILRARLRLAQGRPGAALKALGPPEGPAPAAPVPPWMEDRLAWAESAAHLAAGDPQAALKSLRDHESGPEYTVAAARARLALGEHGTALALLDALAPDDPHREAPAFAVRILLTRAQAVDAAGDATAARRLVARALTTARPEHLRRPFLETGPWLPGLLRREPTLAHSHDWLPTALLGASRPAARGAPAAAPVVEQLSDREQQVLERLAQLMSTEEIAADLYLSVNTVKTHLKSIYRKLAATRRGEAVRRARELHLL
ncbi:LuxR C-terminal-related transcriptional regulator [Streptomyces cadmiisoli]|uniref:LuxR C-terminal-related transcriptional regulator n=1 Tax=Streptomyces cadmiisoli TaxID=2184053 RepID=UPI003D742004